MSLIVRDHTWTQNLNKVYMSVPLKGVKTTNVHVICKDEYLRVSFPPFLFEVFLFRPINEEKSEARIADSVAVFTLQKRRDELWEQLYTNIVFPTALRKSRVPEEEEVRSATKSVRNVKDHRHIESVCLCEQWLKKQAEARRAVDTDLAELDDLRKEERNPDWLKEKGNVLNLGLVRFLNVFERSLFCSPRLHLFDQKYSKNSEILQL
uniref:Dynein axonemal assembly factor 4 n=1 Tax=Cyprinus carpio TaxID=7962 RepID=A0A8C2HIF6_CYPCA